MAKVVKDHKFTENGRQKYDWDKWLDGQIWRLEHGVDFDANCKVIQVLAHRQANQRGKKVRTATGNGFVMVQLINEEEVKK